jgi:hypothetical protein
MTPRADLFRRSADLVLPCDFNKLYLALERTGYWSSPWTIARKRADVRALLRLHPEISMWVERDRAVSDQPPMLSEPQVYTFIQLTAAELWLTLDEIRNRLLCAGWLPSSHSELAGVVWLEQLCGHEDALCNVSLYDAVGPRLTCLAPDGTEVLPTYKVNSGRWWTLTDTAKVAAACLAVLAHLRPGPKPEST